VPADRERHYREGAGRARIGGRLAHQGRRAATRGGRQAAGGIGLERPAGQHPEGGIPGLGGERGRCPLARHEDRRPVGQGGDGERDHAGEELRLVERAAEQGGELVEEGEPALGRHRLGARPPLGDEQPGAIERLGALPGDGGGEETLPLGEGADPVVGHHQHAERPPLRPERQGGQRPDGERRRPLRVPRQEGVAVREEHGRGLPPGLDRRARAVPLCPAHLRLGQAGHAEHLEPAAGGAGREHVAARAAQRGHPRAERHLGHLVWRAGARQRGGGALQEREPRRDGLRLAARGALREDGPAPLACSLLPRHERVPPGDASMGSR